MTDLVQWNNCMGFMRKHSLLSEHPSYNGYAIFTVPDLQVLHGELLFIYLLYVYIYLYLFIYIYLIISYAYFIIINIKQQDTWWMVMGRDLEGSNHGLI